MTDNQPESRWDMQPPATYELTISGPIGPVIRSALTPLTAAASRTCTILRTRPIPGDVLLSLLRHLDRQGLIVEGVFASRSGPSHRTL